MRGRVTMYFKSTYGFYTVYNKDGSFYCTCDTIRECQEEIEQASKESGYGG